MSSKCLSNNSPKANQRDGEETSGARVVKKEARFPKDAGKALEAVYINPFKTSNPDTWRDADLFKEYLKTRDNVEVDSEFYDQLIWQHKRAKDRHYNEHLRPKAANQQEDSDSSSESSDDGENVEKAAPPPLRDGTKRRGRKRKSLTGGDSEDEDDGDYKPENRIRRTRKRLVHNGERNGEETPTQAAAPLSTPTQGDDKMFIVGFPPTKEEKDALLAGINKDQFPCKNFFFFSFLSFLLVNPPNIASF